MTTINEAAVTYVAPRLETETIDLAAADALTFRKKILPLGSIDYPTNDGKTIKVTFDAQYHDDLIAAFRAGAYDNPTLQLATADNAHNMLPERAAADVIDLSREQPGDEDGPGLYSTIRAHSPEHAELLRRNPRLGVSAQIKENLQRVDGRRFKRALRHVLATLDPRVTGLGPWRAVSLANDDDGQVIDLSGADYEEIDMPDDVIELSDDDIEAALEAAAAADEQTDTDLGGDPTGDDNADEYADQPPAPVSLANRGGEIIELAAVIDDLGAQQRIVMADLNDTKWQAERLKLSQAGVPKIMLDLAEPLLASSEATTIELSNVDRDDAGHVVRLRTQHLDPRKVVRDMLKACEGVIDLATPDGFGDDPPKDGDAGLQSALDELNNRFPI